MTHDRKLKVLYTAAYDYLESRIGKYILEQKLNHYRHYKVDSMYDVFWHLINSLTNKVGMRASIGNIDPLESFLFGFDPWETNAYYQDKWKHLFTEIRKKHTPPGPMDINKVAIGQFSPKVFFPERSSYPNLNLLSPLMNL